MAAMAAMMAGQGAMNMVGDAANFFYNQSLQNQANQANAKQQQVYLGAQSNLSNKQNEANFKLQANQISANSKLQESQNLANSKLQENSFNFSNQRLDKGISAFTSNGLPSWMAFSGNATGEQGMNFGSMSFSNTNLPQVNYNLGNGAFYQSHVGMQRASGGQNFFQMRVGAGNPFSGNVKSASGQNLGQQGAAIGPGNAYGQSFVRGETQLPNRGQTGGQYGTVNSRNDTRFQEFANSPGNSLFNQASIGRMDARNQLNAGKYQNITSNLNGSPPLRMNLPKPVPSGPL